MVTGSRRARYHGGAGPRVEGGPGEANVAGSGRTRPDAETVRGLGAALGLDFDAERVEWLAEQLGGLLDGIAALDDLVAQQDEPAPIVVVDEG